MQKNKAFTDVLTPKLEKVENENYYINEKDGKIVSVDYTFNYKQTSTSNYFIANTITFNTPITREDLKNGNISKAKFETKYIVNYNPTIQEKNKSLTNAIFTALGIEDTGATRILVEKSKGGVGDADFGQYNSYKVVEISDNEIKEYDVTVKYSENIIEQIQQGNIRKDSEKSTLTEGDKLTAETTNEKESSAATVYYDNNGWKISLDGEEFTL